MGKKIVITACLCGAGTTKAQTPYVPITPEEIAADSVACVKAGASVIHIHIRDEEGTRLILKYTHDIYDQFWVEKGKLIYDRKNSQGESPFSDGTEFTYADSHIDLSGYYGSAAADLNKNGVLETVYLGLGFTSGVFSFNISVKENGEQIYNGMVRSPYGEPSFTVKNGNLCLRFEVEGGVKDFTISLEENTMILTGDDGEVWIVDSRTYN